MGSAVATTEVSGRWLTKKRAAELIDVSRSTIYRLAIPWQPEHVPGRIRYKFVLLSEDAEPRTRYYEPDLLALLKEPNATVDL